MPDEPKQDQQQTTTTTTSQTDGKTTPTTEDKSLAGDAKGEQPVNGQKAEAAPPLTLTDITLPEGFQADETLTKSFVDLSNKFGISKEAANELVKLQAQALTTASEKGSQEWDALQEQWRKDTLADPEIGGPKWKESESAIAKLLDRFGTTEARQALGYTGAGNNPHLVKMLAKIAVAFAESGPVSGTPASTPRTQAEIMYPNQGKI